MPSSGWWTTFRTRCAPPLTAIGGYAEYIQRADLRGPELQEALDTIRFESGRLLNLSQQLVRLSVLRQEPPTS